MTSPLESWRVPDIVHSTWWPQTVASGLRREDATMFSLSHADLGGNTVLKGVDDDGRKCAGDPDLERQIVPGARRGARPLEGSFGPTASRRSRRYRDIFLSAVRTNG